MLGEVGRLDTLIRVQLVGKSSWKMNWALVVLAAGAVSGDLEK